jgi:peroxiredoxin
LSDFNARGIRVVAISVDPPEISKRHCEKMGFTFPILSDVKAEVVRRYDLLHKGAGPGGTDIARPAEFLIDSSGTIRWVNLTENAAVRARPEQILKEFDAFGGNAAGEPGNQTFVSVTGSRFILPALLYLSLCLRP